MKINTATTQPEIVTHEGGRAARISIEQQLRRTVMGCLLWEDSFYEDGATIASRIKELVAKADPAVTAALAIEARSKMNLRHVPLLLCRELARNKNLKAETLDAVIQRPDELAEFMAIYWKSKRQPLAKQVKLGLARAFGKFNEYALAKYNQAGKVKLKDALFLSHPKPKDAEQDALWKRLIEGKLETPDTWEVSLSAGRNKKETFERLIAEKKLGALALLRNLRKMDETKVDRDVIRGALAIADVSRVLPFRFITAARYAPHLEPDLETCMFRSIQGKLSGKTVLLIDVSGSMDSAMSGKSEVLRVDAACGLAMIAREICTDVEILTFSDGLAKVPPRRGFALRDAVVSSQPHNGTYLGQALNKVNEMFTYDRLIVVSDEQAHDNISGPKGKGYMLNVGADKNGVGYGSKWTHIDGFSEACVRYIVETERSVD